MIVWQEGVDFVIHYLDDYLVVVAPASSECAVALTTLLGVFDRLGLPVAMDKLEGPWSHLTFLGFELDSSTLEIQLPQAQLREFQQFISTWVGRGDPVGVALWWRCNNLGAIAVVNSGYSKVPKVMHLLHCRFFLRGLSNFSVWAVHVPGVQNGWANATSQLPDFFAQVPGSVGRCQPIPPSLLGLLVGQQPNWT